MMRYLEETNKGKSLKRKINKYILIQTDHAEYPSIINLIDI